jgi:DNA-binding transcriptional regulator PaaX
MRISEESSLIYVLKALIPYTEANLTLVYRPNTFFNELERISNKKRSSLQTALSLARKKGYIERKKGIPVLTDSGKRVLRPYLAQTLPGKVQLMVIFDIPEEIAYARRQLRTFLRQYKFKPTQKSVWVSAYDCRDELRELNKQLSISDYVQVYECTKV